MASSTSESKQIAKKTSRKKPSARGATRVAKSTPGELSHREILAALRALKRGEFGARLPDDCDGIAGEICTTFNDLAAGQESLEQELRDVRHAVGREGRTQRRMRRSDVQGGWSRNVQTINELLDAVTGHMDEMARVVDAVARGDLMATMDEHGADEPVTGEFLRHARTVNRMVRQLSPDWKLSRHSFSNSRTSSCTGTPHSRSW